MTENIHVKCGIVLSSHFERVAEQEEKPTGSPSAWPSNLAN